VLSSIIITCIAGLFTLLGIISKLTIMKGADHLFGLTPDAYLRFAELLVLFAIAIACIVKFKKS